MRRWLLRILVALAVLLVVAIIGVQVVLKTNLPRNLVLAQVQKALQLRVDAASLSTGWAGDTVLHDVTLSLPLETRSFLTVKTLRVRHTSLPVIALTQGVKVRSLTFEAPELFVRQDAAGRWNLAEVIDLVGRAGGRKQAQDAPQPEKTERVVLPEVTLTGGIVNVTDNQDRTATVQPLNVLGKPEGPLVWRYDVAAGDHERPALHLVGKLAPGGAWEHEVAITVGDLSPWLKPWLASPAAVETVRGTRLAGNWRGSRRDDGAVTGLLELTPLVSKSIKAAGLLHADYAGGALSLRPERLQVSGVAAIGSDVMLKSGRLVFEGQRLRSENLTATAAGGDVQLTASYALADQSADINARWSALALPDGYLQNGSLTARVRNNFPGTLLVESSVDSTGTGPGLAWHTKVGLNGSGKTFQAINWDLTAPTLQVTRDRLPLNLDGLAVHFRDDGKELRLTGINVPAGELAPGRPRGTLTGEAAYRWPAKGGSTTTTTKPADPAAGQWWVSVAGGDWRVFEKRDVTAAFNLEASGDLDAPGKQDWARLGEFYATTNTGVRVWAGGEVSYLAPGKPADLWLYSWYPPFEVDALEAGQPMSGGEFYSRLHLTGGAWPLSLNVDGGVDGTDLKLGSKKVGDLTLAIRGRAEAAKDGGWTARVRTERLQLLEGTWNITADYSSSNGATNVQLDLEDFHLQKLDDLIDPDPHLAGNANGSWRVRLPSPTVAALDVDGEWHVKGFKAANGQFVADAIDGRLFASRGEVQVRDVVARRDDGGELRARAGFRLKDPTRMQVGFRAAAWPVTFKNGSALVYGQSKSPIDVDFKKLAASGPVELDAYPIVNKVDLGVVRAAGTLNGRTVAVTLAKSEVLGGALGGTASYDLDDLLHARAALTFTNVTAERLAELVPQLKGTAAGAADVALTVGPPTVPRPLGPLQVDLAVTAAPSLSYRTLPIQLLNLRAFYDGRPGTREQRIVIDGGTKPEDPAQPDHRSRLVAAGGEVVIFARATRHPLVPTSEVADAKAAGEDVLDWSYNVQLTADDLDLNQLVHAGSPDAGDHTGRLAARLAVVGDPRTPKESFGEGELRLTKTDLAGNAIIGTLYSALSFKSGKNEGRGRLAFRIEDDHLNVTSFYFFNRGLEARGTGRVDDVWKGADAPINAFVVGSVRPLKDLKLPFAADVDKVFSVVQSNVTTIRVVGTVGDAKPKPAGFGEIGQALRAIILSDVQTQTRGSAAP